MDYIKQRQNNPEYLKTLIAHKQIIIEQLQRERDQIKKQLGQKTQRLQDIEYKYSYLQETSKKEIFNLKLALNTIQNQNETLTNQKNQLEFNLNIIKVKGHQQVKEHHKQIQNLKNQLDTQKEAFTNKISKLQNNLKSINNFYHTEERLKEDRMRVIEDANRDMRGFSNQKQSRMIVVRNKQLQNEIEFQSKNITSLLQKNQKLQQQIKQYRIEVDIHKGIQNDLVKRSSLAHSLIKQLNKRIKELQNQNLQKEFNKEATRFQSRVNTPSESAQPYKEQIMKLKMQLAKQKNFANYLQNQLKNVNTALPFMEETIKQTVNLPKIIQDFEKAYEKQEKKNARFKDIPVDISSKIVRSNLRQWGKKINFGNVGNTKQKVKSRSIVEGDKPSLI